VKSENWQFSDFLRNRQYSTFDVGCSTFKLFTALALRIFKQDMGYKIKPLVAEKAQAT
jgi:hypothetical protein